MMLECNNFFVDESSLTGESIAVQKEASLQLDGVPVEKPGSASSHWVYSGSMAVKGQGVAIVTSTGQNTELGKIGTAIGSIEVGDTHLQLEINKLVRVIATVSIAAAVSVTVILGLTRAHWLEGLLAGVATAMAMIPEEFPVVLAVFMALGAWRLSKNHVLTRRAAVIEALGAATVICTDKTGTLTMNQMTVREFVVSGDAIEVGTDQLPESYRQVAEFAALASAVQPFDPMEKAFKQVEASHLAAEVSNHKTWVLEREYPLTDELLAVTYAWRTKSQKLVVATKGAPEAIAKLCRLSESQTKVLDAQVQAATANGRRVLAVAKVIDATSLQDSVTDYEFELLGLACLQDPVRPGVPEAIAETALAGIRTIMITGDYPGTALAIAREIGLDASAGALTGSELAELSEAELAIRVRSVNVYARVVPEQKLQLVRALKANGEVVAMTGDGVNDSPALKAADIGIAMGKRGTDVAREAAGLVLTDDNFTSIVAGVKNGRGIFENMRKALTYVLAVHVPILGMTLIPVLNSHWPLVLVPVLIAFLELIIDPACSIVFESEPIDNSVMRKAPRASNAKLFSARVLTIALLQGASALAVILAVYFGTLAFGLPDETTRTMAFVTLLLLNIGLILVNRSWQLSALQSLRKLKNPTLKYILIFAGALMLVIVNVPAVAQALRLSSLTIFEWLICFAAVAIGLLWFEIFKLTTRSKIVL
jgi:Ca2+-transporting ATPase